jgi:HNH endonuclease
VSECVALTFKMMCEREGLYFQRGMYFRHKPDHSVILSSGALDSNYDDLIDPKNEILIYQGHNAHRSKNTPFPQLVDQPEFNRNGTLSMNGRFFKAASDYAKSLAPPEAVRVYRKLGRGMWLDLKVFHLVDAWKESDGRRLVFKLKLRLFSEAVGKEDTALNPRTISPKTRVAVWNRDAGRCVICGSTEFLHFDHIIPVSKGGGNNPKNIRILCAKHNLAKSDQHR